MPAADRGSKEIPGLLIFGTCPLATDLTRFSRPTNYRKAGIHASLVGNQDGACGRPQVGSAAIRAKNALAEILERFLAEELQPWTMTFPFEFYRQIFRLRDWPWHYLGTDAKPKKPSAPTHSERSRRPEICECFQTHGTRSGESFVCVCALARRGSQPRQISN